jgi:hypothetical protein
MSLSLLFKLPILASSHPFGTPARLAVNRADQGLIAGIRQKG